ncbi:Amino acid transporter AVT6C [Camellia lanceoleosa]|uniref:Amino acid transporter AVT6C n=1 Tax=Camellia lanceoleosa TaxID=1840588 RepID=A0ACC0FQG2_9ERIC|nr:Amino acid transporter AVT6C [Camellia lanceoleosa]
MKSATPNDGAGAIVLFLPKLKSPVSVAGAVFNVSTSIVGAGIMSILATIKVLGVIPAFVSIAMVAILVDVSVEFMMRFTNFSESSTYATLMYESFGRGCPVWNASSRTSALGHFTRMVRHSMVEHSCFRTLLHVGLRYASSGVDSSSSSAVSVLLAVVFVGICSVMAIFALLEGKAKSPRLMSQLDDQASFFNLFTDVPVIVTAFTFHFNVHPIGTELEKPSDMTTAVRISLLICSVIYSSIGIFGYLLFGDSIMSDILVNFDQNSDSSVGPLLNDIVRLSYALHLMLVFPLLNFSLRANLDELIFPKKPPLAADTKRFLCITFTILIFSYLAAIAIPNIWYFFSVHGINFCCVPCLHLPRGNRSEAFLSTRTLKYTDVHGISETKDKIVAAIILVLAVITSAIAISINICNFVGNKS